MLKLDLFSILFCLVLAPAMVFADSTIPDKLSTDDAVIRDVSICLSLKGFPETRLKEIPGLSSEGNPVPTGMESVSKYYKNDNILVEAEIKEGVIVKTSCTPRRAINPDRLLATNIFSAAGFKLKCTSTFREYNPLYRIASLGFWRGPKIAMVSYQCNDVIQGLTAATANLSAKERSRLIRVSNNAEIDTQCTTLDRNLTPVPGPIMSFSARVN